MRNMTVAAGQLLAPCPDYVKAEPCVAHAI